MALSAPLDQPAFDALLAALSSAAEGRAEAYEALRLRLIRFFAWEGCSLPEDAADETLNRVATRLVDGGEKIHNVLAYASGVARLVAKEALRNQGREQHRQVLHFPAPKPPGPDTAEVRCFDRCLSDLPAESRQLLLEYYKGDATARIEQRRKMAAERNISLNSLRNRALRLREKLEASIRECLAAADRRDVSPDRDTKDENV